MKPSGLTGFARIRAEIRDRTHDSFVDLIEQLFGELVPGFAKARRLQKLDRRKIDLFQLSDDEAGFRLGVQCKGFERPFGDDQLKQCLKEIKAYLSAGEPVEHYMLIVNKRASEAYRRQVQGALTDLTASGKVKKAEFLDLNLLERRLKSLALDTLGQWAIDALERFRVQFQSHVGVVDYIREVPFRRERDAIDPVGFMLERLSTFRAEAPAGGVGRDLKPPRFIVTSSFGFGKTSALQALGSLWAQRDGRPIYIPAALLPDIAFRNNAGLAGALLDLIRPEGVELSEEGFYLLREVLRSEMSSAPGWVLLLDGMDEHPNWRDHNKLGGLWMSSADLGLPLIVSVRDEVFESRTREFQDGGGRALANDFFDRLRLKDWTESLILRFLGDFRRRQVEEPGAAFLAFEDLIRRAEYDRLYSDIPKRPLFLGMLASDAWAGRSPQSELHRLYGAYVRRKLHLDRYSFAAGAVVRSGEAQAFHGEAEWVDRMVLAMQDLAGQIVDGGPLSADNDAALVTAETLSNVVDMHIGIRLPIEDLLLNSLLLPAGRHPQTRQRLLRFAHQSFFDWFAARWVVSRPELSTNILPSAAARSFAESMWSDLRNGLHLP